MPHFPSRLSGILFLFSLLASLALAACEPAHPLPDLSTPVRTESAGSALPSPAEPASATPATTQATPDSTAQPDCKSMGGSLVGGEIDTSLLDKPMRYKVYLPPCYGLEPDKRYPVLYLLHGQNFDEEQWIRIGAPAAADGLEASGELPPFIMVFPYDYSYKQPTEYKFEDVFVGQLIPAIDGAYLTKNEVKYRAIGGLSRGGAWALHIGADHPELFGTIGGHSPSIFVVDEYSLRANILNIPAAQQPRIWLDAGDHDSEYALVSGFEDFLNEHDIPHEWHTLVGWHDEQYWSGHVSEYLRWYAQNWN